MRSLYPLRERKVIPAVAWFKKFSGYSPLAKVRGMSIGEIVFTFVGINQVDREAMLHFLPSQVFGVNISDTKREILLIERVVIDRD
jgi:hypothetical protein